MHKIWEFDSWGAFVDQAEHGETDMPMVDRSSRKGNVDAWSDNWHGASWTEALKLARIGWPDGARKVKAKLDLLHAHLPSRVIRNEMQMQMVGPGTLDMHRYQIGHPEPWVTWQPKEVETDIEGQIVPILFNITSSAGVSTIAMFDKGATICALVDLLERTGKRVELILAMQTKVWDNSATVKVMVKKSNEPLDLDRVAYALAHASCFRRLGFSLWEQASAELRRLIGIHQYGGYGRCSDIRQENSINILSSDLYSAYREADQFQWLKKQLATQGVDLQAD